MTCQLSCNDGTSGSRMATCDFCLLAIHPCSEGARTVAVWEAGAPHLAGSVELKKEIYTFAHLPASIILSNPLLSKKGREIPIVKCRGPCFSDLGGPPPRPPIERCRAIKRAESAEREERLGRRLLLRCCSAVNTRHVERGGDATHVSPHDEAMDEADHV